ncbi:hypothetical protein PspLS_06965 [Pyricularia sp. CBS 133598]|nr:hypothetical protein PspLS_06965 [Pyricularia sp. CBS 133598]
MFSTTLIAITLLFSSLLGSAASATAQIPNVVYRAEFRSQDDMKFGVPYFDGFSANSFSTNMLERYSYEAKRVLVRNSMRYRPYDALQKRLLRFKTTSSVISTSSNRDFPEQFALRITNRCPIYIYYIDTSDSKFLDMAAEYAKTKKPYPHGDEAEFLILSAVPWRKIVGWIKYEPVGMETTFDVLGTGPYVPLKTARRSFVKNVDYRGDVEVNDNGDIIQPLKGQQEINPILWSDGDAGRRLLAAVEDVYGSLQRFRELEFGVVSWRHWDPEGVVPHDGLKGLLEVMAERACICICCGILDFAQITG